ncbi:MAG: sterol desaturase family protein [Mucilaginibacter polytrichastri]|nr:sterol desaturase family protein [Mucilaginibacter polytrichastri]
MNALPAILIVLATFGGMELISWTMHKYLFHGPLWFIHKTHHRHRHGFFEWNDLFSIGFAAVSLWLMWLARETLDYRFWIGAGISLYGLVYFIFHDWFIHNRFRWTYHVKNKYLLRLRRAHKMHHKSVERRPSTEYGLLIVSKKWGEKGS